MLRPKISLRGGSRSYMLMLYIIISLNRGERKFTHSIHRYRLMLRRCLESQNPCFGMIMPPRSSPTGHSTNGSGSGGQTDYGTMLEIRSVQMLPDGRSMVETFGSFRFRILERGGLDGYLVGRIERSV